MKSRAPAFSLPRTLFWLTLFFMAAQILYFTLSVLMAGILHVLAATTISWEIFTAPIVFFPFLIYLGTQFLVYALYAWLIWYIANAAGSMLSMRASAIYSLGIMLWIISAVTILSANSIYFNQSIFALPFTGKFASFIITACYWAGIISLGILSLLAALHLLTVLCKKTFSLKDIFAFTLIIGFASLSISYKHFIRHKPIPSSATASQPNIILISVEALRPDYILPHQTMPFLAGLLQSSIQFTDAYTPIAQSFPSWISLLTGKTPLHHGARSFYANVDKIDFNDSLIQALNTHGYESVYAVDGQRFGDMTTKIGFNRVISPPYGAAELLIGSMSDFPLSNLLLATRVGKYFFPYSYANRTIAATYRPEDFTDLLAANLSTRSGKPLFLSVHFGLSHWPYRWAGDEQQEQTLLTEKYRVSLSAADRQIRKFYNFLQDEKLLDHAIIIFMSDHGTGLGMPGDSLTSEKNYVGDKKAITLLQRLPYSHNAKEGIDTSYGYSTDILSMQQYHVLLAFKTIGFPLKTTSKTMARASLIDIAPTLLDLLNIRDTIHTDGISLVSAMKHRAAHHNRELFLENGFTAPEISQAKMAPADILKASIRTVLLDPASGLLYVNDSAAKSMLKNKERALLYGDWLLARRSSAMMVLANIRTGKWTTDLHSALAQQAPVGKMMRDFRRYNAKEI